MRKILTAVALAATLSCNNSNKTSIPSAIPAASSAPLVEQAPDRIRCYDQKDGTMFVNTGSKETKFSLKDIGVEKDSMDFFCTDEGYLFWVTDRQISIRKFDSGKFDSVLDFRYITPPEYSYPEGKSPVVSDATIWKNPKANWEDITVATITEDGILQISRHSLSDYTENHPNRTIFEFARNNLWPDNLSKIDLKLIDQETMVLLFAGQKGAARITHYHTLRYKGALGERFEGRGILLRTHDLKVQNPGLRNIFDISRPTYFDNSLGGWVTDLQGENYAGKPMPILPQLASK